MRKNKRSLHMISYYQLLSNTSQSSPVNTLAIPLTINTLVTPLTITMNYSTNKPGLDLLKYHLKPECPNKYHLKPVESNKCLLKQVESNKCLLKP